MFLIARSASLSCNSIISDLSVNDFVETFKKVEGCERTNIENVEEWFKSDKDLKHETIFNEDIIRAVLDVVNLRRRS